MSQKIRFSGEQLAALREPCVYFAVSASRPIYIGRTKNGLARVFGSNGLQPEREQAFSEADYIEVICCATSEEAQNLERIQIHEHHPRYNRLCPFCGMSTHPLAKQEYIPDEESQAQTELDAQRREILIRRGIDPDSEMAKQILSS